MGALKIGRGTEEDVKVGPLMDEGSREKVAELVADAVRARREDPHRAARSPDGRGYFYPPTVLADVPEDARVFNEEIFGPVAPIAGFSSEDEAIERGQRHRVRPGRLRLHAAT